MVGIAGWTNGIKVEDELQGKEGSEHGTELPNLGE